MTSFNLLLRPVAAALAAAGLAVGGAASASATAPKIDFTQRHPVPAGQVQHLVTEMVVSRAGEATTRRRTENWTATAASRTIVTNIDTGRVTYECGSTGVDWSCYFPDENVLEHGSGNDPLVNASWRDQAEFWKQLGGLSGYRRVGRSTDVGRPVTVYASKPHMVGYEDTEVPISGTIDVDDELGFIMKTTASSPLPDGTTLRSEIVVTTMETLTSAPVPLGVVSRPGAKSRKVTGQRLPAGVNSPAKQQSKAKANKKSKAKAKGKAKKKSAAKHHKTTKKPARR
jgi:hypothetical protein